MTPADIEVGQIWDDIFGSFTWEIIHITENRNAVLRDRTSGTDEILRPAYILLRPGTGWRWLAHDRSTYSTLDITGLMHSRVST